MGSSFSPPQYLRSLVVVGGPPYSPGATPVDHFMGFLFGSRTFVGCCGPCCCCVCGVDDIGESCDFGFVPVFTIISFMVAIFFF